MRNFWRCYCQSGYGPAGLVLLAIIVMVALLAPRLAPYDPGALNPALLAPPSVSHPLGTDHLGRDVLSGLTFGTRVSLIVGFTAAIISAVVGTLLGAVAGYAGGLVDEIVDKIISVFLMVPTFFLILLIVAMYGNSFIHIMLIIGLTIWPSNARLMRAQALSLRERTFTKATLALGETHARIVLKHIVPNGIYPVIANTTLQMGRAILTEASLSFIGLGDANIPSWGRMISEGRYYILTAWWATFFPGLAILLTVMSFYFIGDGLNLALNPKLHEGVLKDARTVA